MRQFLHFLVVSIVLILTSCNQDDSFLSQKDDVKEQENKLMAEEGSIQESAFSSYEALMSMLNSTSRSSSDIQKWYGGSYINNSGELVIRTTDPELSSEISLTNTVFEKCDYSLTDLEIIRTKILSLYDNKDSYVLNHIIMFGVNPVSNSFEVGLDEVSEDNIEYFVKNISSCPAVQFIKCGAPVLTSSQIKCAGKITNLTKGSEASMGYRAKKADGTYGIVTAGHFISKGQVLGDSSEIAIGECVDSRNMDGVLDAAFCKITNSDYEPSNQIDFMTDPAVDTLSVDLAQPPTGSIINMVGMISGRKSGTIHNASKDIIVDKKTLLKDAILMTCLPAKGDSGGIVYALTKNINKRSTVGISVGTVNAEVGTTTTTYGMCCKAYLINQLFGIKRY